MTKLFVDMDGVLADFDSHHEKVFGYRSDKLLDNVDWKEVRRVPNFYRHIPPMADMRQLWDAIRHLEPTVLTGIPSSIPEAPANKREWIKVNLGPHVPVVCCPSKEKCLRATPGAVLIDDWEKYRHLWEDKGGVWITHLNAELTIEELKRKGMI